MRAIYLILTLITSLTAQANLLCVNGRADDGRYMYALELIRSASPNGTEGHGFSTYDLLVTDEQGRRILDKNLYCSMAPAQFSCIYSLPVSTDVVANRYIFHLGAWYLNDYDFSVEDCYLD